MSIRIYDGKWLLAGDGIATGGDCCCDSEPFPGPCEDCLSSCVCVVLNGHNFCEASSYSTDDCDGVFEDCVRESWFRTFLTDQYFYTREEYGTTNENNFTPSVGYTLGIQITLPPGCVDGLWVPSSLFLASDLREGLADAPFVKDRAWSYSPEIVAGIDGCPESVRNGDYVDLDVSPQAQSSLDPIVPSVSFQPCPPPEPFGVMQAMAARGLPGTELKALLKALGIVASPSCGCNKMAAKMDAWGPDESLAHMEEIVDVMQETAKTRGLPFVRTAGRQLVRIACWKARRKARQMGISSSGDT